MHTLIVGLDAFDPAIFERLYEQGKVPHLGKYVDSGRYSRFAVVNPPQSEVSWTSIATGLNPGGHGMFDFVHRDPATYTLSASLLPTKRGFAGTQFVPPHAARTIFDQAVRQGFPATALWWPATFPARPESPVRTVPGLGTPDIQGRLGLGAEFSTSDEPRKCGARKTPLEPLQPGAGGRYIGHLKGPLQQKRGGSEGSTSEFAFERTSARGGRLKVGRDVIDLVEGQWSPIFTVSFKMGFFVTVRAITRVILTQTTPDLRLYFLPLQIHPLHSHWRYGTPGSFVKQTWKECGPFLTLGWPQDTTALEDGCLTDEQFLALCDAIFDTRRRILLHQLQTFHEGLYATVFDTLDRVQHMFWRDRPDVVEQWYIKLDALIGQVEARLRELGKARTRLVVVSDHGFCDFAYKVHLNRWLVEQGHLVTRGADAATDLRNADWTKSAAYAVGLNSIYVNLMGREGQGSVPLAAYDASVAWLQEELLRWQGPDGRPVVQQAWRRDEVLSGPLVDYGPDLIVGYTPGYRASADTGLGKWKERSIESNHDHWGADHCVNAEAVAGVVFASHDLANYPRPSYLDFPALAIDAVPDSSNSSPPPPSSRDEDQAIVEERLRSLGYL